MIQGCLNANDGIKNSDYQPKVENEEKLKSGREVGKGGVQGVGHLGSEVDHLDLIDQKLIILIILIRS